MIDTGNLDWSTPIREACVGTSCVWVVFIEADATIVLDIVEAVVLPAATTAEGIGVTVNALLLRQLQKLATLDEVLALHGANS